MDTTTTTDANGNPDDSNAVTPVITTSGANTSDLTVTEPEPERLYEAGPPVAGGGRILESLDDGEGWVWRVTMVEPGWSRNGRRYRREVLQEAAPLYEGAQAFDGHRDLDEQRRSGVSNIVGFHSNVAASPTGALESDFTIAHGRSDMRALFLTAWRNNQPGLLGFSHDISGRTTPIREGGRSGVDIGPITAVHSVDVVATPSAGGRIQRLVASTDPNGGTMDIADVLAQIDPDDADAAAAVRSHFGIQDTPDPEADAETPVVTEAVVPQEDRLQPGSLMHRVAVQAAVSDVPEGLRPRLTEALSSQALTPTEIVARVTEAAGLYETALGAATADLPGQQGRTEVTADQVDRHRAALDGLFAGAPVDDVPPFRSLKEAYFAFTGTHPYSDHEDTNRRILAESVGAFASMQDRSSARIMESVTSGTWSNALGDSITRRAIAEYQLPALQSWRRITSDVVPVSDFRTQRRDRVGGYDVLPVVGEAGVYQPLTSPTDEEATYAPTKKGGVEDLTLETIANDDVGVVRRIPSKLGRAAALTLYRAIWIDTIAGNPLIYDGVALFAAGHNNTTAAALGEAGIGTLRTKMVKQTQLGETSGWLGAMPRFVVTPADLYVTGFKLTESRQAVVGAAESATTRNAWEGLEHIEVPLLTDTDDWYIVADPASVPTIEVGFYQGREDPEILVQDAPSVGSVFTADKITYKVRHIWGLTVLDYRGFQRGTQ